MTMNESLQYLKNYNSILKGEAIKKPNPWTLLAYMARRGSEGWEMVQATRLAQQIGTILDVLGLTRDDVRQVRLARWGHSMPIASPRLIADGVMEELRRPFQDQIHFVHCDNWGLPAVETCLLEAEAQAPKIARGL